MIRSKRGRLVLIFATFLSFAFLFQAVAVFPTIQSLRHGSAHAQNIESDSNLDPINTVFTFESMKGNTTTTTVIPISLAPLATMFEIATAKVLQVLTTTLQPLTTSSARLTIPSGSIPSTAPITTLPHANHPSSHPRNHKMKENNNKVAEQVDSEETYAYTTIVSNEEYVDGALALGWSLRNTSAHIQKGRAHLVMLAPATLHSDSVRRLNDVGWDVITYSSDLKDLAPEAIRGTTFNKLLLFNLTQFTKVVFLDADMACYKDPDHLLDMHLHNASWVGAVGPRPRKDEKPGGKASYYFQSGLMVLIPNTRVFEDLMRMLRNDDKYHDINGRDGELLRDYFTVHYSSIHHKFSRHLSPEDESEELHRVVCFHYRGDFKPWFNKVTPHVKLLGKRRDDVQDMGRAYYMWWEVYEDMHLHLWANETELMGYGPKDSWGRTPHPGTHVWMMRGSEHGYTQPLTAADITFRNITLDNLLVIRSKAGDSCSLACSSKRRTCYEDALWMVSSNSISVLTELFPQCVDIDPQPFPPLSSFPGFISKDSKCVLNPLANYVTWPLCSASMPSVERICSCVPSSSVVANGKSIVTQITEQQLHQAQQRRHRARNHKRKEDKIKTVVEGEKPVNHHRRHIKPRGHDNTNNTSAGAVVANVSTAVPKHGVHRHRRAVVSKDKNKDFNNTSVNGTAASKHGGHRHRRTNVHDDYRLKESRHHRRHKNEEGKVNPTNGNVGNETHNRHHHRHHADTHDKNNSIVAESKADHRHHHKGTYAYTTIVSNEEYVDGALALGWSLRNTSAHIQKGRAHLVMLAPATLHSDSVRRLNDVGWDVI
eukprot:PhF_6_TR566/c0_g1_i6/m.563